MHFYVFINSSLIILAVRSCLALSCYLTALCFLELFLNDARFEAFMITDCKDVFLGDCQCEHGVHFQYFGDSLYFHHQELTAQEVFNASLLKCCCLSIFNSSLYFNVF